uniref:Uncharacterized protein n=1 Tax=Trichobilharzia regenti TaxID=157069 RepID=A0AA85JRS7_TRIRE|nr:unnamed protein product [Trichobilharzia regenti]
MCPISITYPCDYLKCFQPDDLRVYKNLQKKHHGWWQRSLKCTPMHQMTVPVIFNTNRRSLSKKINYLDALLCSNIYRNTSVITLQETRLQDSYDDNLILPNGFNMYR